MNFEEQTFSKESYKFNEVTSLSGVKPYVLRFWESEFDQINPSLSEGGQKVYSQKDLDAINRIKGLLFDEKLSIPQVKAMLDEEIRKENESSNEIVKKMEQEIVDEATNYSGVAHQNSSLDLMRNALAHDLIQKKEALSQKQFNDEDVLNLVQAKKKLTGVLSKINSIISENNW